MKKKLLTAALLTLSTSLIFADMPRFSDVKAADWYSGTVTQLTARGGITGYDDGTFRPGGTITRAEYTAIVARSLGVKAKEGAGGHWASGLMIAAQEAGLVKAGEFPELDRPITRNEMARMAVRALGYQKEEVPSDYRDYEPLITDLNGTGAFREDVARVVALGIINGYPDKTFQGTKTLTRAEASTVVVRILEKEARKVPVKPSAAGQISLGETKPVSEILPNDYTNPLFTISGYKNIALVEAAAYAPKTYERSAGGTGIMFKGHGGNLVIIKDNKVLAYKGELYDPKQGYSLYSHPDWETADYFGFAAKMGDTMPVIANPWKK